MSEPGAPRPRHYVSYSTETPHDTRPASYQQRRLARLLPPAAITAARGRGRAAIMALPVASLPRFGLTTSEFCCATTMLPTGREVQAE